MSAALDRLAKWRADLPTFAAECLKIRDKAGVTVPFVLNPTQQNIHARLEEQKRDKGWVRALVLKARQPGVSTYVAARFYHRTAMTRGVNTYILAHEQPATDNLFDIVDRYQRHNPIPPQVGAANVKELQFSKLDSSYQVATAGQKAGGRGRSITLFHGSEVAYWSNAKDHFASSVQAVPLLSSTEIILESTGNGVTGEFYERWQRAEAGKGDYIAIFEPWFNTADYAREPEEGFEVSTDAPDGDFSEADLITHFGLSHAQLAWRRSKIDELGSLAMFQQEYPAIPQEAFIAQGLEPFIPPKLVIAAQKRTPEGHGPLVLGVDPAGMGGDRFAIAARRGYAVLWIKERTQVDPEDGAAWVRSLIDEFDPARVNIDAGGGGNGAAIISRVKALGPKYVEKIRSINFGGTAEVKLAKPKVPGPANRRAEMWGRLREWLMDPVGASLPAMQDLAGDISAPQKKPKPNGDWLLESKLEMKARKVRSPDLADAVALTFAVNEFITKYSEVAPVIQFGDIDKQQKHVVETQYREPAHAYSWMR